MRLVAALLTGLSVALAVGAVTGSLPEGRIRWRPRGQVSRRQLWLIQAGADLTPRQFVLGSVLAGAGTLALILVATETVAVAVVPALVVTWLPRAFFARRRSQRLQEIQSAWPDGIRELMASISGGASLNQALSRLARTGPEPLRAAFARYPALATMLGVVPALEVIKEELADPASDRVIEVLILAHERGGHILGDILHDLADATTRDLRTQEDIATARLEQVINARAVFVLPWLVLLALTVRPGLFRDFYGSPAGLVVVLLGGLLSLGGLALVGRLARDEPEQRVFGGAAPVGGGRPLAADLDRGGP